MIMPQETSTKDFQLYKAQLQLWAEALCNHFGFSLCLWVFTIIELGMGSIEWMWMFAPSASDLYRR